MQTGAQTVPATEGKAIVLELVAAVRANAAYLSEVDGAIGDGDHGVNMSKGCTRAAELLARGDADLAGSLNVLGKVLLTEIGGAMGPLYGTFFLEMGTTCQGRPEIDAPLFGRMLAAALAGVVEVGGAQVGDKTLVDTLAPAVAAYQAALEQGLAFDAALAALTTAAEAGKESTRALVAKVGRASRLGERSRGVLDAGATSCCLILCTLADSLQARLPPI
jgi:phosphoenolpyruvate---glycerone phosphotransferase subunit DhaL